MPWWSRVPAENVSWMGPGWLASAVVSGLWLLASVVAVAVGDAAAAAGVPPLGALAAIDSGNGPAQARRHRQMQV